MVVCVEAHELVRRPATLRISESSDRAVLEPIEIYIVSRHKRESNSYFIFWYSHTDVREMIIRIRSPLRTACNGIAVKSNLVASPIGES
jgi:hypothetical protein